MRCVPFITYSFVRKFTVHFGSHINSVNKFVTFGFRAEFFRNSPSGIS